MMMFTLGQSIPTPVQLFLSANGITDTTYVNALVILYNGLVSNGLYSKIQAWWIFYNSIANSKYNFKNPINDNSGFRLQSSGGTYSLSGWQTDGNSVADTNFNPSIEQDVNGNGILIVVGTNNSAASSDTIEIGAYNSGSQESALLLKRNSSNQIAVTLNGSLHTATETDSRGVWTGKREGGRTKLIKNGNTLIDQSADGSLPNTDVFIGCLSLNGSGYGGSNQRIQQAMMLGEFTDAEAVILGGLVDTFENSLGRKTW
jgi:hypothetical protein